MTLMKISGSSLVDEREVEMAVPLRNSISGRLLIGRSMCVCSGAVLRPLRSECSSVTRDSEIR